MRVFAVTYDPQVTSPAEVKVQLDELPAVLNWYTLMRGTILIVSEKNVHQLQQLIQNLTTWGKNGFLIVELGEHDGWLPASAWDFIDDPRPARRSRR